MIASGVVHSSPVYPDASGKITSTPQGRPIGICVQAAGDNNSVIEISRSLAPVVHITKNLVAASVSEYLFTADRAMKITLANLLVAVAGSGGAATVAIRKITKAGTALPGDAANAAMIEVMSATMDKPIHGWNSGWSAFGRRRRPESGHWRQDRHQVDRNVDESCGPAGHSGSAPLNRRR